MLAVSGSAAAQEWAPFTTVQDGFTISFPGQPKVVQTTWRSQRDFVLPARVRGPQRGGRVGYVVGTCCVAAGSIRRIPPSVS